MKKLKNVVLKSVPSIDCSSLARIRTLGPVKVREFVSFMR